MTTDSHVTPSTSWRGEDATLTLAPARHLLRGLLQTTAARSGFSTRAIESLIAEAQMTRWLAGQRLTAPRLGEDPMQIVVGGAMRIDCTGYGRSSMTVRIVPPGWTLSPLPLLSGPAPAFDVVAHVPSLVAMVGRQLFERLVRELSSDRMLQLMAHGSHLLADLVAEKCQFLVMPLRERLLHELSVLARDFGRNRATGTVIDLRLTQDDLARLVAGSRANVCRAMVALRKAGHVRIVGGRILLSWAPRKEP